MHQDIEQAIAEGRLVLLLGAGASSGAKDGAGRELLMGDSLAEALCSEAKIPYLNEPLPIAYAAARRRLGERVDGIFRERFTGCTPSPAQIALAKFPWPRIYTLNIDDSFDRALRNNSPQKVHVRQRSDWVLDRNQLFDEVDLVKLNGAADFPDLGFIFSAVEYGAAAAAPPGWYEELGLDFFKFTFLFVGTRLNEPLFYHQIARHRSKAKGLRGGGFVLTRSATDAEVESLRSLNLEHIPGSLDDFAAFLGRRFPKGITPWDLATIQFPQLVELQRSKNRDAYSRLFEFVQLLNPATAREKVAPRTGAIRDFYRGFKPDWTDIFSDVPAWLDHAGRIYDLAKQIAGGQLLVVTGPAGSGKTTAILQIARALAEDQGGPVYFLSEPTPAFTELVSALEDTCPDGYWLVCDKVSQVSDKLLEVLERGLLKKGRILAAERSNVWSGRLAGPLTRYKTYVAPIGDISSADADRILSKLEDFGPFTRLAKLGPAARKNELYGRAKQQLLIGLLEATRGIGFQEIIRDDFESLPSEEHRLFVLIIGLATTHRLAISLSLAARGMRRAGVNTPVDRLLEGTIGIVSSDQGKLFVRHPVYTEHLFYFAAPLDLKGRAIHGLLSAFTVYQSPVPLHVNRSAGTLFKLVINHRFLVNVLHDKDKVLKVYHSFEKNFQNDGLFWLQYGLALRDFHEQDLALDRLRTAVDAYRCTQTQHALAQQLLIIADRCDDRDRAMSLLSDARGILESLTSSAVEIESAYPSVTLAEAHTGLTLKYGSEAEARNLARSYAIRIAALIERGFDLDRVRECHLRLTKFALTGTWSYETSIGQSYQ